MPEKTSPAVIRHIARQIKRMSDAELYALAQDTSDPAIRHIAMQSAHNRAEEYALSRTATKGAE
jgi:hypothetical protein